MKDWSKLLCVIIGLVTFAIIVLAIYAFHFAVDYAHKYSALGIESSDTFSTILSYSHNGIMFFFAIIIGSNIFIDINK